MAASNNPKPAANRTATTPVMPPPLTDRVPKEVHLEPRLGEAREELNIDFLRLEEQERDFLKGP